MLLHHGPTALLKHTDWFCLEFHSLAGLESTLHRLIQIIPEVFKKSPCELFLPISRRDVNEFALECSTLVYIRGDRNLCARLKTVTTGLTGAVTVGDNGRIASMVVVPDSFVQERIVAAKKTWAARSKGVKAGSFCRVTDGRFRDFCCAVVSQDRKISNVCISLKDRQIFLATPTANLLRLDVPAEKRVWYFSPLVEQLADTSLIAEDRRIVAPLPPEVESEPEYDYPALFRRKATATALLAKLVDEKPYAQPLTLARNVLEAIKAGKIRRVKNLFIIWVLVKRALMQKLGQKNWRSVIKAYGIAYRYDPEALAALVPELGLGVFTANPAPRYNPVKRLFDTRIRKLHGQGMAITGMAAVLGLAPSTVCRIMKRLGLRRNSWRGKSRKRG